MRSAIDILEIDGILKNNLGQIVAHLTAYNYDMFTEPNGCTTDTSKLKNVIPTLVMQKQATRLVVVPSMEEVRATIFYLDLNSAAGPNGYTGRFFQASWESISVDIFATVREFFALGKISQGLNSSTVVLILKEKCSIIVGDFRPIVLNNFLFKVFTKVLSSRLEIVVASIVFQHQFGFIPNRHIHDVIAIVSEGVNCLNRSVNDQNLAFKVDIKKAFDTLRWEFVDEVLFYFGFPLIFRSWIKEIFSSARLSILVNGVPHGYFACTRGVRQVDSLSPLIFSIAKDALSWILQSAVDWGRLTPMVNKWSLSFPTHILYINDIFIFAKATSKNVRVLASILDFYTVISGQVCSPEKYRVLFGCGVRNSVMTRVHQRLHFVQADKILSKFTA